MSGSEAVPERWWTTFEDPDLESVVEEALEGNLDLLAAWHRLQAAQAAVDVVGSDQRVDLHAFAQARVDEGDGSLRDPEDLRLGLAASYEIDLWGRIRAAVEAERFRARASAEDYRAAALSLTAEIARAWFQLAEARLQLALLGEQVETNETLLESLDNRFGLGQVRAVDVLRQQRLLASTREEVFRAERRIAVLENRIAVLLGRPAREPLDRVPSSLPALPPLPDTGLPAELVRRRPDVRRAFAELMAADRDVASAISNRYPRLTLAASAGGEADDAGRLFQNWAFSLLGDLVAPLLRGGELRAEVERASATEQAELAEYGRTVLEAFREVEDALVEEAKQREVLAALERQVELAETTQEQLRQEYFHGSSDFLDSLTALDELQELRRDRLAAELELVELRVGLYRALAGSFDTGRDASGVEAALTSGPGASGARSTDGHANADALGNGA